MELSESANTGRKVAMLALGLEVKSSPFPNLNFMEDEDEDEGTSEASEAAAIQPARQHTQAL